MGCAEVLSCTEVRASKQWEALRQQLHQRFDPWLDTLEPQRRASPTTLSQVSDIVWGLRQSLAGGITETIVKYTHEGERQRKPASCPRCARVLKAHDHVWREAAIWKSLQVVEIEAITRDDRMINPACNPQPTLTAWYP